MTFCPTSCHGVPLIRRRPTGVVGLFSGGGPTAIPRLIVAVVVDAIDAVCRRWTWSHVRKERFKGFHPAITYPNAAFPIVLSDARRWMIRTTPLLQGQPRTVFSVIGCVLSKSCTAARGTVCGGCTRGSFLLKTSTAAMSSAIQLANIRAAFLPTVTSADPLSASGLWMSGQSDRYQAIESSASEVKTVWHSADITTETHVISQWRIM